MIIINIKLKCHKEFHNMDMLKIFNILIIIFQIMIQLLLK